LDGIPTPRPGLPLGEIDSFAGGRISSVFVADREAWPSGPGLGVRGLRGVALRIDEVKTHRTESAGRRSVRWLALVPPRRKGCLPPLQSDFRRTESEVVALDGAWIAAG
jgi:hypothetical protein